jgi:hypothetical protein
MSSNVRALAGGRLARSEIDRPNRAEVEAAFRTIIRWAGDDQEREGLVETPARMVRAFEEFFAGYAQDPVEFLRKTFEEIEGYDEMIVLRGIRFESHCEHTDILAPLDGTVVSRNADLGQTVAAGSEGVPLFLIGTDLTIMQVNAKSNHTFDGEVVQIRRSMRENATTSDVVISAPNRELLLQSGMKATVQILVDKRDTVL